jgi:hypothetical protein
MENLYVPTPFSDGDKRPEKDPGSNSNDKKTPKDRLKWKYRQYSGIIQADSHGRRPAQYGRLRSGQGNILN